MAMKRGGTDACFAFYNSQTYLRLSAKSYESEVNRGFSFPRERQQTSERHQNNNLKATIAYAEFLGSNSSFYQISTKEQITEFLDTKIRSNSEDPDQSILTGRISTLSILKPVLIKWIT